MKPNLVINPYPVPGNNTVNFRRLPFEACGQKHGEIK
jgi:hypothetical protein